MAFKPELASGETLQADVSVSISNKTALRLVLTDRAAYWPGSKLFAVSDAVTTEKLETAEMKRVVVGRKGYLSSALGGVVLVVLGLVWTFAATDGHVYVGMPQAMMLAGLCYPWLGTRRRVVRIEAEGRRFAWTSPVTFGATTREIDAALETVSAWAGRSRLELGAK